MGKSAAAKAGEKRRRARVKAEKRCGLPQGALAVADNSGVGKRVAHGHLGHGFGHPHHQLPRHQQHQQQGAKANRRAVRKHLEHGDVDRALLAFTSSYEPPSPDLCAELMAGCLKVGRPGDACRAVEELQRQGQTITTRQLTSAVTQSAQLSDPTELAQFVEFALAYVTVPGPPSHAAYFKHFTRLSVMEFAEEAAQALDKIRSRGVSMLQDAGLALSDLRASAMSKGGQLLLVDDRREPGATAVPRESQIMKGDFLLLQRVSTASHSAPITYPVHSLRNHHTESPSMEIEAEVITVLPELTVKVAGSASLESVRVFSGVHFNAFKLANKLVFTRKMDALRTLLEERDPSQEGGLARAQREVDGVLRSLLCSGFGCESPQQRAAATVDVPHLCAAPPTGSHPYAAASAPFHLSNIRGLNKSQEEALRAAISRRFTLVQGPPGTGKTHTAITLISLWLKMGQGPVLATSDSNIAVDNLVEGLAGAHLRVVRIGRPEAIRSDLGQYTLEAQAAQQADPTRDRSAFHQAQQSILKRAQVVCVTCSGAGSEILGKLAFPNVLIDEASQATEPSTITPMVRGARQVALVGDHRQLPPTIISREAELAGLNVSLFDRLVAAGVQPFMLDTQYRMHPALACFPSKAFYNGMLKSGTPASRRPPVYGFDWPLPGVPVAFLPCNHGSETKDGSSYSNDAEARAVARVVDNILAARELTPGQIGVVAPYAGQVRVLRRLLRVQRGASSTPQLEVSSVDGFQGREKEVIVFSCVRSNVSGTVGFLSDARRVNVMLTRAKRGLVVVGSMDTLAQEGHVWAPWLSWATACGLVVGQSATDRAASEALRAGDADYATWSVPCIAMRGAPLPACGAAAPPLTNGNSNAPPPQLQSPLEAPPLVPPPPPQHPVMRHIPACHSASDLQATARSNGVGREPLPSAGAAVGSRYDYNYRAHSRRPEYAATAAHWAGHSPHEYGVPAAQAPRLQHNLPPPGPTTNDGTVYGGVGGAAPGDDDRWTGWMPAEYVEQN